MCQNKVKKIDQTEWETIKKWKSVQGSCVTVVVLEIVNENTTF